MLLTTARGILVHEHVKDMVQAVLDHPVPLYPSEHLGGTGLFGREIGDEVDRFDALFAAALMETIARESAHLLDACKALYGEAIRLMHADELSAPRFVRRATRFPRQVAALPLTGVPDLRRSPRLGELLQIWPLPFS